MNEAGASGSAAGGAQSVATAGTTASSAGSSSAGSGSNGLAGAGGMPAASGAGGVSDGGAGSGNAGASGSAGAPATPDLEALQRDFVNLRFGMFLHFGILTYTGSWAQANLDITQFNPTGLNPAQWADAAVAAHMKYAVLTTKHHDGFALWPSAASDFNVGHIPWLDGKGDVVRAYVDAFRARGVAPGLYYSIYDTTRGVTAGSLDAAKLEFIKTQLTELLSNYGPIPILVIDGWSWQMGHNAVAYQEIHELVKSLQPNCLITDHTHLSDPWEVEIVNFEEPAGAFAPTDNKYPGQQEQKVNSSGGNDWFWAPNVGGLLDVPNIVTAHLQQLEPRWTNFLLNMPPNRAGLLDDSMVSLLQQVGAAWSPNAARPPLPAQGPQNQRPYTPVSATATSGSAEKAIDGHNDGGFASTWEPTGALPQSLTLDLGEARPDVAWLGYVPRYASHVSSKDGNITGYGVLLSSDGTTFKEVGSGTWPADARMHVATFPPTAARYVRLEVRTVNGTAPAVLEVSVGGAP
jgi:alpha-L-fucosidase